jgi:DNA-binding transcriptional LysR family regulator
VEEEIKNGLLVAIRIPGLVIKRGFYAARRAGRELSPAAAAFRELMLNRWGQHRQNLNP